jgi:hypothetical protein
MCGVNTVEYIQNLYKKNQQQCLFKVQPIYENWLFDSMTSEHQESTGPEYRNEGNQICWTQN